MERRQINAPATRYSFLGGGKAVSVQRRIGRVCLRGGCHQRGGKEARVQAQALHCMHVSVRVRARRLMIGNSFLPRTTQGGMVKAECRLQCQIQLAARVHMFYD